MADITIDAAAHSNIGEIATRGGIFWTSSTVGYVVYSDGPRDLKYNKTADGGATWGGAVNIKTGTILAFDCWADWQTEGDAGTKIHIAYLDAGGHDVRYIYLDTDGDSIGGDDPIEACQGTGAFKAAYGRPIHRISISKTRGGNLAIAFGYSDHGDTFFYEFYTSPDGDTWTNEASPWEADADHILLFPGNEADNQDVWALFWDASADEISLKTYDDSGNSWSEQSISGSMVEHTAYLQIDGAIRLSDGHLIVAAWSQYDNAASDLMTWDINGAGSITAKTNIITNEDDSFLASVFINQDNDDIYVAYVSGTFAGSAVKAFYQLSQDGGANWDGETALQADAEDDERWVSCGAVKAAWGGKFLPVWFNDDLNDLFCNTDNSISIAASGGAALEKSLSDTITIADVLIKDIALNKADTLAIADTISKATSLIKADSVAIADTFVKAIGLVKSEAVTIIDSFTRVVSYILSLADTVAITDSVSTDLIAVVTYLKQSVARMEVKGIDIAKMSIKRMGIDKMPLYRWITRRWTA